MSSIDQIRAAAAQAGGLVRPGGQVGGANAPGGASFGDTLKSMLGDAQQLQDQSADAIGAFMRGEPVEIHEVMAAVEEAGIALEFLIELRNRLTEAYRSVVGMQS